jgi:hypothetical protein
VSQNCQDKKWKCRRYKIIINNTFLDDGTGILKGKGSGGALFGRNLKKKTIVLGDCHDWNKIYFRDLCRNKPRINLEYLRIE